LPAESEFGGAVAVGQEAVVADALKTGRDGVLEETANELVGRKRHELGLVAVAVILLLKRNLMVFQCSEALVGNGDAVGVAVEIV